MTAVRLDKYMGKGTSKAHDKIALVYNVLNNAERELRNGGALTKFDRTLSSGGNTLPGYMVLGSVLDENTILHEAVHYGTAVWRSDGHVPHVADLGNGPSYSGYGSLQAALERGRYGWERASISAASYSWVVTGP